MSITSSDLEHQLTRFGLGRVAVLRKTLAALTPPHVSAALALAIGSRESGLTNIVGDQGHGRGVFQQDDRFQVAFLRSTRGCRSGTYVASFDSALPAGRVPTLSAGCRRMIEIIEANVAQAIAAGVPDGHRLQVAVAGYNAGFGGALAGWRAKRNPDLNTTGGDYSRDVLARAALVAGML
jgi:hypothetical protein